MKQLNTFNKATKFNKEYFSRVNSTVEFMEKDFVAKWSIRKPILDIAGPNAAGDYISSYFNHDLYNTEGNLDTPDWTCPDKKYKYVYCFEVLEHLLNPLLFLTELKKKVQPDTRIFVTVPYHFLRKHWGMNHWHEMDLMRLHYLFDLAGLKIIRFEKKNFYGKVAISEPLEVLTGKRKMNHSLWYYFKKLRFTVIPLIDYLTGWFWIKKTVRYYFELEYK